MGVIKTAADIAAQNEKIAQDLLKKCVALCKKQGNYIGHFDVTFYKGEWVMTIHNSAGGQKMGFSLEMEDVIDKHPRAKSTGRQEYPGNYDWASRTYNEDASEVTFKIT